MKILNKLIEIEILKNHPGCNPEESLAFEDGDTLKEINRLIKESIRGKSTLLIPCYSKVFHPGEINPENYFFYLCYNGRNEKYTIYDDHPFQSGYEYTDIQNSVVKSTKDYLDQVTHVLDYSKTITNIPHDKIDNLTLTISSEGEKFDDIFPTLKKPADAHAPVELPESLNFSSPQSSKRYSVIQSSKQIRKADSDRTHSHQKMSVSVPLLDRIKQKAQAYAVVNKENKTLDKNATCFNVSMTAFARSFYRSAYRLSFFQHRPPIDQARRQIKITQERLDNDDAIKAQLEELFGK
jgi:hypothetical protein